MNVPGGTADITPLDHHVCRTEGLVGLYRGFGASVATFVPSSAIWWGSYGAYQKFLWQQLDRRRPARAVGEAKPGSQVPACAPIP